MEQQKPESNRTWVEVLTNHAKNRPDQVAIRFLANGDDVTVTLAYRELHIKAQAIGEALSQIAQPGDRALILLPNDTNFITTFFGCLYAGLIAVPGYPPRANRNQERLGKMLQQCGASLIIGDNSLNKEELLGTLASMNLRNIQYVDTTSLQLDEKTNWRSRRVSAEDIAFLQYTSGSTGDPKGVMLTHLNLLSNVAMMQKSFQNYAHSRHISWLPLYHDMGLIGNLMGVIFAGCEITLMPPMAFIQRPMRWIKAISKYKGTITGGPNFAFDLCVRRYKPEEAKDLDLSSLELLVNAAEPIRHETLQAFASVYEKHGFNRKAFAPYYGLAEATLYVSGGPIFAGEVNARISREHLYRDVVSLEEGKDMTTLVSSGEICEELDVQIVDPKTLKPVSSQQVGEILVSGVSVSSGYWDNAEANKEIFGVKVQGQGDNLYLRTGDLGFVMNKNLFVTGRIKDVIIINGKNHYPQDIEATVQAACNDASIVAAFALDHSASEKLVVAVEVNKPEVKDQFAEISSAVSQALGNQHEVLVHQIVLVGPGGLPRTSSGKIQRRLTRSKLLDQSLAVIAIWTDGVVQ